MSVALTNKTVPAGPDLDCWSPK